MVSVCVSEEGNGVLLHRGPGLRLHSGADSPGFQSWFCYLLTANLELLQLLNPFLPQSAYLLMGIIIVAAL